MANICCPFDSAQTTGGLVFGGSALVDIPTDPYDGITCVLPLDEIAEGDEGEYVDRTRNHFDGTAGKILDDDETADPTTYPTVDNGVFCLPSQRFSGRQLIHIEPDNLSEEFTVTLWFKYDSVYKTRTFYSRGYDDGTNKYVISLGHSFLNTLAVSVRTVNPVAEVLYFGSTTLTPNTWYHAGLTYSANTLKLYVNGVLGGSKVIDGDLINLENECWLGTTDYASNLEGNLQEFRLYPEAKSAAWLLAEYRSVCNYFVSAGAEEPLLYW